MWNRGPRRAWRKKSISNWTAQRVLNAVFDLVGADDGDASLEGVLLPDFGLCARSYFSVQKRDCYLPGANSSSQQKRHRDASQRTVIFETRTRPACVLRQKVLGRETGMVYNVKTTTTTTTTTCVLCVLLLWLYMRTKVYAKLLPRRTRRVRSYQSSC